MYCILTLSKYTRRLISRNDSLAVAGFRVVSPRVLDDAPFLAHQQDVDVVIVGHSVEPAIRATLIEKLRRARPDALIAFVFTGTSQCETLADVSLDVTRGNEPLLEWLASKLPKTSAAVASVAVTC